MNLDYLAFNVKLHLQINKMISELSSYDISEFEVNLKIQAKCNESGTYNFLIAGIYTYVICILISRCPKTYS